MTQGNNNPTHGPTIVVEDDRTGTSAASLRRAFLDHVHFSRGRPFERASPADKYHALALVARDRVVRRWTRTISAYAARDVKQVYYLSAEYLPGRLLVNNLINLGLLDDVKRV
ncbi:MAG TPA: hypothetical protein VFS00_18400, partial [Polyangiaceae bacterium]|nr:hypothetical protein [Polyangiaceae bacterium]